MIRAVAASLVLFVTACGTTASPDRASEPASTSPAGEPAQPGAPEELAVGTLPGQRLTSGECGLFLFTPRPSPRFVFFAAASTGVGRMVLNDREMTLARTSVDGDIVDQHYTEQAYQSAEDISLKLSLIPGRRTDTGFEISNGSLRVDRADGWTVVLPVSGSTHCAG